MKDQDTLRRFVFDKLGIRGEWVRLETSWKQAKLRHRYPQWVQQQLGQMLAATTLLSATIKFNGSLILQVQGEGALQTMVAQCTHNREVRGWAKYQAFENRPEILEQLCTNGRLVLTVKSEHAEPYQGIVALQGNNFAEAIENYFKQSEQLLTRLWLFADETCATGLFIQELPDLPKNPLAWERIEMLANTVTKQEMLDLPCEDLLYRLFNEEQVRLFDPESCVFKCTCSEQKVEATLAAMGRAELQDILLEKQEISVNCEFCSQHYQFDPVDVERILSRQTVSFNSTTTH